MAAEKPIIRIAVPGDTAEEFMQAAAKQFRGDFFVAIDQPVGKFVRVEAPFLTGGVAVRGDAIAMPAVRNGRKGLVIRLVKLDSDSLGIPIPEASKQLALSEDAEESAVDEFEPQPTMASNVSAAVAMSIKASAPAVPRTAIQPTPAPVSRPAPKPAATPTKLEDLDPEAREAVDEFGGAATKASALSADIAKTLAEPHAVRRTETEKPKQAPAMDDDAAFDSAFAESVRKPGDSLDLALGPAGPPVEQASANAARADGVGKAADAKPDAENPKPLASLVDDGDTLEVAKEFSRGRPKSVSAPPMEREPTERDDAATERAVAGTGPAEPALQPAKSRTRLLLVVLLLAVIAAVAIFALK